jgi:hypothetical protein
LILLKILTKKRYVCCLPLPLEAKYHPYIILVLYLVLISQMFLAVLASYIIGLVYAMGWIGFIDIGPECIEKIERSDFVNWLNSSLFILKENGHPCR